MSEKTHLLVLDFHDTHMESSYQNTSGSSWIYFDCAALSTETGRRTQFCLQVTQSYKEDEANEGNNCQRFPSIIHSLAYVPVVLNPWVVTPLGTVE